MATSVREPQEAAGPHRPPVAEQVTMLSLGADFMAPFWEPECNLVRVPMTSPAAALACIEENHHAHLAYAMNTFGELPAAWEQAKQACRARGIPTVWHTIEDPNSFEPYFAQAAGFDAIATTDGIMRPAYRGAYPGAKVVWLPLAAQPALHRPAPLEDPPADFVAIANWYENPSRLEGVRAVFEPLVDAGFSLVLFCYPSHRWPEKFDRYWRGATNYLGSSRCYPAGRIALGINNQSRGTTMTSMRTFEALSCGKPLLAAASDAYRPLGFEHGKEMVWSDSPEETLRLARDLLEDPEEAARMAQCGRAFVLAWHTYRHRLSCLLGVLYDGVDPGPFP